MKSDPILTAIINFLVPLITLYGLFFLADIFEIGFFAIIYSIILFISAFLIFTSKFANSSIDFISSSQFDLLSFFILSLAISYLMAILLLITDLFRI